MGMLITQKKKSSHLLTEYDGKVYIKKKICV